MTNKTLFWILLGVTIALSAALLSTALRHDEWRGFWVSWLHLSASTAAVYILLRER